MRNKKNFRSAIALLQGLAERGSLEPEKLEAFIKAISRLEHAVKVGKPRDVHKAVNEIARLFLEAAK